MVLKGGQSRHKTLDEKEKRSNSGSLQIYSSAFTSFLVRHDIIVECCKNFCNGTPYVMRIRFIIMTKLW